MLIGYARVSPQDQNLELQREALPKINDSKIESAKKLLASGVPPKDVAKNRGVSVPALYRWVPSSSHA